LMMDAVSRVFLSSEFITGVETGRCEEGGQG
jgi:hypothetical protein